MDRPGRRALRLVTRLPERPLSATTMADDAGALLRALDIPNPHVAGFSMFDVMPGGAHQPFQELPDEFNARVDAFWCEVDAGG